MLNQVLLVGRLTKDPEMEDTPSGKKLLCATLAVQRTYKNLDGIYEADFIRCTFWNQTAELTSEHCHKGDIVGIKGRIEVDTTKDEEGNIKYYTNVVCEKIVFLSSKKDSNPEL